MFNDSVSKTLVTKEGQRVFICGDIHGNPGLLVNKLKSVNFRYGTDICICTGDLVDRGNDSEGALVLFLGDRHNSLFSVRGNHEEFLVDGDVCNAIYNGGQWWVNLDEDTVEFYSKQIKQKMPYTLTVETPFTRFGVVHAEVPYEYTDWDTFVETLPIHQAIWSRDFINYSEHKSYIERSILANVEFVFHGHTPVDEPTLIGNRWYIDTGANWSGNLTLAEVTKDGVIFQ